MAEQVPAALAEHLEVARRVEGLVPQVDEVARRVIDAFSRGGRVFAFGNGGSAADAQHLAAELVGRYKRDRRSLPAVALTVDPSVVTAIGNDYSFEDLFARQVEGLVGEHDVVIGFTTSGRSENVRRGLAAARSAGATTVLFSGGDDDGDADAEADHTLVVPSSTTARVQEMHLLLMHLLLDQVDAWAAGEDGAT
jgi:D-sedoheptulose 7-phosphate isomerase